MVPFWRMSRNDSLARSCVLNLIAHDLAVTWPNAYIIGNHFPSLSCYVSMSSIRPKSSTIFIMNSICLCAAIWGKLEKWISIFLCRRPWVVFFCYFPFLCLLSCHHLIEVVAVTAIVDLVPPWSCLTGCHSRSIHSMIVNASHPLFVSGCG